MNVSKTYQFCPGIILPWTILQHIVVLDLSNVHPRLKHMRSQLFTGNKWECQLPHPLGVFSKSKSPVFPHLSLYRGSGAYNWQVHFFRQPAARESILWCFIVMGLDCWPRLWSKSHWTRWLIFHCFLPATASNHTSMSHNGAVLKNCWVYNLLALCSNVRTVGRAKISLPIKRTSSNRHIFPYHRQW